MLSDLCKPLEARRAAPRTLFFNLAGGGSDLASLQ